MKVGKNVVLYYKEKFVVAKCIHKTVGEVVFMLKNGKFIKRAAGCGKYIDVEKLKQLLDMDKDLCYKDIMKGDINV